MRKVCLDANIWIKLLTEEPDSLLAQNLVTELIKERVDIVAPSLMKMEVGSILRKKWSQKLLSHAHLHDLWHKFNGLPITYVEIETMYETAWHIAENNQHIHLYDAVYLAVCEDREFWTADERLVNAVRNTELKLNLLSSYSQA